MKYFVHLLLLLFVLVLPEKNGGKIAFACLYFEQHGVATTTGNQIWGWSESGNSVKLKASWDNKQYATKANSEGYWELKLNTRRAGGPFTPFFWMTERNFLYRMF